MAKLCSNCDEYNPDGALHCRNCGTKLTQEKTDIIQKNLPPSQTNGISYTDKDGIVSVTDWLITLIALSVPGLNFIIGIIWIFSGQVNQNRKNFVIAYLIFYIGLIILNLIIRWLIYWPYRF